MTRDLTTGRPMGLIIEFAIPTMLGLLFQQLYAMVDTMIVGKLLGADALAAVGSTGSLNFLVIGFCVGICNGFAIPVAQALGEGNHPKLRKLVCHCGYLSLIFAAVLTLATCLACNWILVVTDTPSDIFDGAHAYIFIIFCGIPATFFYNMPAGIIRSLGDSRTPVYFLALASLLNILLDVMLIVFFGLGVAGAALATVISQGVAGLVSLWYMVRNFPILHSSPEERELDGHMVLTLVASGLPMGLQYSITAIGCIVLQAMINGMGTLYVAATTAGWKVYTLFVILFDALGATMATYCGQNLGAKKLDRLWQGIRASSIIGFWYSAILLIFIWFTAPWLSLLFLNAEEVEIIQLAVYYLRMSAIFSFPLALVNILRFSVQGMGFSNLAVVAGVMELVARAVCGLLIPTFGFIAAALAAPVAWILADVFLIPAVLYCIKKLKKDFA